MSNQTDSAVDDSPDELRENTGAVDAEYAELLEEARRLRRANTGPRRDRWPASDYY